MKINLIEKDGVLSLSIGEKLTTLKKDAPINFQDLIDAGVNLKFNNKLEYQPIESDDVQNKVIIGIVTQIVEKYNSKCDEYNGFKAKIDEEFKEFIK